MANIFTEGFETPGNGTRYVTSVPEFADATASGDHFTRTDGSNIVSDFNLSDITGSFWFSAADIDGEVPSSRQTLGFSGVDISDFENLSFSIDLAEDDSNGTENWDQNDFFSVEVQIDGGGYFELLRVEAASTPDDDFNHAPRIDKNSDGNFDVTKPVEQPGFVALFDAGTLTLITTVDVGNLPDQLTFNADGTTLLWLAKASSTQTASMMTSP